MHCPIRKPNTFVSPLLYCSTALGLASIMPFIVFSSSALSSFIHSCCSSAIVSGFLPVSSISRRIILRLSFDILPFSASSISFAKSSAVNFILSRSSSPRFILLISSTTMNVPIGLGLLYAFSAFSNRSLTRFESVSTFASAAEMPYSPV